MDNQNEREAMPFIKGKQRKLFLHFKMPMEKAFKENLIILN
jgi:hypothetical protein